MKALILKSDLRILVLVNDASELRGAEKAKYEHSDGAGGTLAVLVDIPDGFEKNELIVNPDFSVTGDTALRDARLAVETSRQAIKDAMNGARSANSIASLRTAVVAILEHLGISE